MKNTKEQRESAKENKRTNIRKS